MNRRLILILLFASTSYGISVLCADRGQNAKKEGEKQMEDEVLSRVERLFVVTAKMVAPKKGRDKKDLLKEYNSYKTLKLVEKDKKTLVYFSAYHYYQISYDKAQKVEEVNLLITKQWSDVTMEDKFKVLAEADKAMFPLVQKEAAEAAKDEAAANQ